MCQKLATKKRVLQRPKVTYTCEPYDIQDNKKRRKNTFTYTYFRALLVFIIFQQHNIKTVLCPFETVKLKICGLLVYFVLQG